jgi:hypothetical protein
MRFPLATNQLPVIIQLATPLSSDVNLTLRNTSLSQLGHLLQSDNDQ